MTKMDDVKLSRRSALAAAGGGLAATASASQTAVAQQQALDLSDPKTSLEAYAKLRGSTADETVYQVYGGNIFLAKDGAVPEPIIGFWGLQKANWRSDGNGGFLSTDYDLGLYVDYESREILDVWENPLTGKATEVVHYRSGPSEGHHSLTAQSESAYGSFTDKWQVTGDHASHESTFWSDRENLLQPDEYPLGSTGERFKSSMSYTVMGRMSELTDSSVSKVPCTYVWTYIAPYLPWMEMGQRPGNVAWRWLGHKVMSFEDIPQELIAGVEKVWPGYVEDERPWEEPSTGWHQYRWKKQGHTPT